jgi:hypothetical protein
MIIWIAVLAAAAFVVSVNSSLRRRDGLLELGSVSTRWLAEHRQYEDGGRLR